MTRAELEILLTKNESEILEFKANNQEPERIGKYISALANSASMLSKQYSYLVWGITDDKEVIGTDFNPEEAKKGGEPLISWLERMLDPRISIRFNRVNFEDKVIVVLVIHMTAGRPVTFKGERYVRSGSSVKNLAEFPEKERELWRSFNARAFEKEFALTDCTVEEIYNLLDIDFYLERMGIPQGIDQQEVLGFLEEDFIIEKSLSSYNITNLGAFAFAKNLTKFEKLKDRSVRLIAYSGNNKLHSKYDQTSIRGAAVGFENLLINIDRLLPFHQEIYASNGQRIEQKDYPTIAIRELIANQLIHQDFSISGSRPFIEIFDNRIEISNPGAPINEPIRLLDMPPISRNETLANLFKKLGLIEARGSGIDKVVVALENNHLPAPDIIAKGNNTIVTLSERKNLQEMNEKERVNAIYYHAARLYNESAFMTNQTVIERFGLVSDQHPLANQAISLALQSKLIKPYNAENTSESMQYIPFWGKSLNE